MENRREERNTISKAQTDALVLPRLLEEATARGALNETLAGRPNLAAALRNPVNTSNVILQNLEERAQALPRYTTRKKTKEAIKSLKPVQTASFWARLNEANAMKAEENVAEAKALRQQAQEAARNANTTAKATRKHAEKAAARLIFNARNQNRKTAIAKEAALTAVAKNARQRANNTATSKKVANRMNRIADAKIQSYMTALPLVGKTLPTAATSILPWRKEQERRAITIAEDKKEIENGTKRPDGWGIILYSPATGDPINKGSPHLDVKQLEALIDIFTKSQKVVDMAPSYEIYNIDISINMYGLIQHFLLNPFITMDEIVSFYLGPITPGYDMYEALSRLFVFFGGIPEVNPTERGEYRFLDKIEPTRGKQYINKIYPTNKSMLNAIPCRATCGGGVSDITIIHRSALTPDIPAPIHGKKVYLMSVKWLKAELTPQDSYDIEKLHSYTHEIRGIRPQDVSILVFLKTRGQFIERCAGEGAARHPEVHCEQIYGWIEDVHPFLTNVRNKIFNLADERKMTPLHVFDELYNIH
jgi:hypothetical protein